MKLVQIFIYIIGLQYISLAQSAVEQFPQVNKTGVGFFVSSDEPGNQRARYSSTEDTRKVIITSIPFGSKTLSSYVIDFDTKGSFTFSKDSGLDIPFNTNVFIEDRITGKMVNLSVSGLYTFRVDELIQDRFVLHVLDKAEPGTEVTSR